MADKETQEEQYQRQLDQWAEDRKTKDAVFDKQSERFNAYHDRADRQADRFDAIMDRLEKFLIHAER